MADQFYVVDPERGRETRTWMRGASADDLTDEMVERAARKLATEFGCEFVFDEEMPQDSYDAPYWRHVARQALAAALDEVER